MSYRLLAGWAVLVLFSCQTQPPVKPTAMNQDQLKARLESLDLNQENKLEALANEVASDSIRQARRVVQIWLGADAAMSQKAMYILGSLGELAVVPLLETPTAPSPEQEAWLLRTVVQKHVELRRQLAERMRKLLDDQRLVPQSAGSGFQEETPPQRRVCDEAFILLRRFVKPEESIESYHAYVRDYLRQPETAERRHPQVERVSRLEPLGRRARVAALGASTHAENV